MEPYSARDPRDLSPLDANDAPVSGMDDTGGRARTDWYSAVQGEAANAALMVVFSLLLVSGVVLRTHAGVAAVIGGVLGALMGAVTGRQEADYLVSGLRASGRVTRTWKDPNPAAAVATVVSILVTIVAGSATQSGIPGYLDLAAASAVFFLLQGSISPAFVIIELWGFAQESGRRVEQRIAGSAFEYRVGERSA